MKLRGCAFIGGDIITDAEQARLAKHLARESVEIRDFQNVALLYFRFADE